MAVRLIIRMEAEKIDDAHTAPGRGNPFKKVLKHSFFLFFKVMFKKRPNLLLKYLF